MNKTCCVITRAYEGELPYILSFVKYYLEYIKVNHIFIIVTDNTDFNILKEYSNKITFINRPATNSIELRSALCDLDVCFNYDYALCVDVDEFLYLHLTNIEEFIRMHNYDYYNFKWLMCPSLESGLTEIIIENFSIGHTGKVLFKINKMKKFLSEHDVKMKPNSRKVFFKYEFDKTPFLIHATARGIEDILIKGHLQVIKEELQKTKYSLSEAPKEFANLPTRFRLAYFQTRLPKINVDVKMPKLPINRNEINKLFKKYSIVHSDINLSEAFYDIKSHLELYNSGDITEINFIEFIKKTSNSNLSENL